MGGWCLFDGEGTRTFWGGQRVEQSFFFNGPKGGPEFSEGQKGGDQNIFS